MNTSSLLSRERVQKWEESCQQLERTVIAFLDSCSSMEHSAVSVDPDEVISSINSRLESFKALEKRLRSARASMNSLKNMRQSSIHRLPVEILTGIFHLVIYRLDERVPDPAHLSYDYRVKSIYRKLYRIFGVCSAWKNTLLSQGAFWSLVPVLYRSYYQIHTLEAARRILERTAGSKLHLVGEPRKMDAHEFILDTLARFGSRVEAFNFSTNFAQLLRETIHALVKSENNHAGHLTRLALYYTHTYNGPIDLQSEPWQKDLNHILESLQVLRLRQVRIKFRGLLFNNLTELSLQGTQIGTMGELEDILWALSSSSQLHLLEFISIAAPRTSLALTPRSYTFPISLPSLKVLYLRDLAYHVLEFILESITLGSYHVNLHLKALSVENFCLGQTTGDHPNQTKTPSLKVDRLTIGSRLSTNPDMILPFLRMVSNATELFLDRQELTPSTLRPFINSDHQTNHTLLRFTKLHIAHSFFDNVATLDTLRDVVSSHPIVDLGLGLGLKTGHECSDRMINLPQPHEQLDAYTQWFLNAAPKVAWLPGLASTYDSLISNSDKEDPWQL